MERSFSIQFVSKITGINAHTIRAWEKRYAAVVPKRSDNGKRIYSQADVDRLKKLHELVKLGNAISDVAKLDEEELSSMYADYVQTGDDETVEKIPIENIDIHLTLQNLILALKSYKLDIISHELEKIKSSVDSREFALSIITPLLAEVGKLVENEMLNVAQEHALSSVLRFHIGQMLYKNVSNQAGASGTVVLATPEGELHEFGILIAALLCGYYEIYFLYLGPSLPAQSLKDACNQTKADYVIIGVSNNYNNSYAKRLDEYVQRLANGLSDSTEILVGGDSRTQLVTPISNRIEFLPTLQMLDQKLSNKTRKAS